MKIVNYSFLLLIKVTLLVTICFLSSCSFSQNKIPNKETEYVFPELNFPREFDKTFEHNDFIYTIWKEGRSSRSQVKIAKFDKSLGLIKESVIYSAETYQDFVGVKLIGEFAYLFYSSNKESIQNFEFFAQQVNLDNLSISTEKISVATQIDIKNESAQELKTLSSKEGIITYQLVKTGRFSTTYNLEVISFDSYLKQKWKKISPLTSTKGLQIKDAVCTLEDELIVLVENSYQTNVRSLVKVSENESEALIKNIEEEPGSNFIDMKLKVLKNKTVALAGFYEGDKTTGFRKGTFLSTYNSSDLALLKETKTIIPISLLLQDESEIIQKKTLKNVERKQKIGIDRYYVITHLIESEKGEIILVAEHRRIDGNTYNYMEGRKGKEFAYLDLLVIAMDDNGDVVWEKKISKSQKTSGTKWLVSFDLIQTPNSLLFIFNDHMDNHMPDNTKTKNMTRNKKEYALSIFEINESGYLAKDVLASYSNYQGFFVPSYSSQINSTDFLGVMMSSYGNEKLVLFQF